MTTKMLFGNFKGGVGKTTNSVMVAYELAKKGYKTLVCDLDPQANSTQLLRRTYGLQNGIELPIENTMMVALQENTIKNSLVKIMNNLYLLPSHKDFVNYPDFLELKFLPNEPNYKKKRISFFQDQLSQIEMISITLYLMYHQRCQFIPIQPYIHLTMSSLFYKHNSVL